MPKVYVTNFNPDYSYDAVSAFGEPVFMSQGFVPPSRFEATQDRFDEFAQKANEDDFLLLSGATILAAFAVAAWLRYHPAVTVLQHTPTRDEKGRYVPAYTAVEIKE